MSYLKLLKTCSDHAVGMQSVNQAIDNNGALYSTQFDPNHSTGSTSRVDSLLGPGRHDDTLVARGVFDFIIRTISGIGPTAVASVGNAIAVGFPARITSGQWRIYVLTRRLFSAVATIKGATAGIPRYATCFVSADSYGQFVTVSTWNVAAGVLDDYDFSLAIWAEGVD